MQEVIEAVKLCKEFYDFWGRVKAKALDNLDLVVHKGEIFGLLGPNGSGKTTTIKLMLGLLFPTSGTLKIFGCSPRHVANKNKIGFLPEESYLYPYHTAEEALFFYGRLFGLAREVCNKRVDELLEMVGLFKNRKRPIKEYSKGMARRIGLAQALINDPELVFLDEPTSGLDPIASHEVKDLILQLKQHGKTVVLCSHLLGDVEDICDTIAILYGGRLQAQGSVQQLLNKPLSTQIAIDNISPQIRNQLLNWLAQNGIHKATVTTPKERLESFFLRVIESARTQQIVTSGAEAGKSLDNFFSDAVTATAAPPNQVIAQLLQPTIPPAGTPGISTPAAPTLEASTTSAKTPQTMPNKALLDRLVVTQPRNEENTGVASATTATATAQPSGSDEKVNVATAKNKGVLDKLLRTPDKKDRS